MKKLLLLLSFFIAFTALNAQKVGISTSGGFTPTERLHVDGSAKIDSALIVSPQTVAAAATITVTNRTTVINITAVGGTQANAITYSPTPTTIPPGQIMYVFNADGDPATFAGTTIPAGGFGTFLYLSSNWRVVGVNAGSGGDNLGNHIATANVQLNNNWLSNDGGSEGVQVDNSGNVTTSGNTTVTGVLTVNGNDVKPTTGVSQSLMSFSSNANIRMKLDIDNNSSADFAVQNGSGTNVFTVTEAGNFTSNGSGTIDGDVNITGTPRTLQAADAFNIKGTSGIDFNIDSNNDNTSSEFKVVRNSSGTSADYLLSIPEDNRPLLYSFGTSAGQTGGIRVRELAANGTNFIDVKAPDLLGSDLTLVLPSTNGTGGNALLTNGSGTLSWGSPTPVGSSLTSANMWVGNASNAAAAVDPTGDWDITNTGATTVTRINGATVPAAGALTTGNGLYVTGTSALNYSALNLAGGSGYITGTLPIANGGTGSATQNWVDLTTTQTAAGAKTWSGAASFTAAGTGLAVTNNATVGGTLAVTGTSTLTGNVGIGAAPSTARLHIVDAGNVNIVSGTFAVFANNLTQGIGLGYMGISAIGSNTNQDLGLYAKGTTGNLVLNTNGINRMVINGAGTVQLNAYTTNGIVRATSANGTLTSGGNISLTSEVTGVLPVANGGTGSGTQNWVDLTNTQTVGGAKTFTAATTVSNDLNASKYVIQNSIDGTNAKGIWFWNSGDSNWGMYMGTSGAGKSLSNGTATTGSFGSNSHSIRIRTYNDPNNGLIYENSAEQLNFAVRASDGAGYFRGNLGVGAVSPGASVDIGGNPSLALRTPYLQVSGNNSSFSDRPYLRGLTDHLVLCPPTTAGTSTMYLAYTGDIASGTLATRIQETMFFSATGSGGNANVTVGTATGNTSKLMSTQTNATSGTGYATSTISGVMGTGASGSAQYAYGVTGYEIGTGLRSGGVHGAYSTATWSSLGYYTSGSTAVGLYFTSSATGAGFLENNESAGVGSAGYGDFIGSWTRGGVIGQIAAGDLMASYNAGNEYTSGYQADVVSVGDKRVAAYSMTSTDIKVFDNGTSSISGTSVFVPFTSDYAKLLGENPTVTITPIGNNAQLYIAKIDKNGFTVASDNGAGADFTWIAVGKRVDAPAKTALPADLADNGFDNNLKGYMFNEANTEQSAKPMWWDGTKIRFEPVPKQLTKKDILPAALPQPPNPALKNNN